MTDLSFSRGDLNCLATEVLRGERYFNLPILSKKNNKHF